MKFKKTLVCLALSIPASPALAAQFDASLKAQLSQLAQRLEQLEADNRTLQTRLAEVEQHEEKEAMAARLEDLEIELLTLRRQARTIEAVEGISVGAAMTMVAQTALAGETDAADSQLNYRADVSVTLPGGEIGDAEGRLFVHFRLGQGQGLALSSPGFSSTPNSTAFESEGDDAAAVLAQAWYQLDVPLEGAPKGASRHLEVNFGKIDPFVFFDQNAIADDESTRFLNNAFVHNPLLDSGGAVGVDAYGFTPGARLAYHADGASGDWWRASLGAFGAGEGASFGNSFSRPFLVAQLENGRQFNGLAGNYRLYAWTNGSATPYSNAAASDTERQSGWGLSADQQITETATVFARYGQATQGSVRFDQAITAGVELSGAAWGREKDRLGIAGGWLRASKDFEADAPVLDADGVDGPDFGYAPSGAEYLAELYYAWQVNEHLELTPDLQWIARPGADGAAEDITVVGLRATMGF
ncbi:MAG: carbohydrate porin [Gammaproteobacteria bacterium]|nr:carbohydrate porin [Gammaproteobacteria bacterium]